MTERRGARGVEQLLICRVGANLCGLPLSDVIETMRPLAVERLANMPSFVGGLALIRGRPTPVVDGRVLLLGSSAEPSATARYVMLALADRRVALLVDAVLGIRDIDQAELQQLPLVLRESQTDQVGALGALDAELLLILEHARLLNELRLQPIEDAQ
jgi:purine-binding chemotaxis protein CheW